MIKFKDQYLNHTIMLPNKVNINQLNVHQYEKIMKDRFPDMIEEVQEATSKKVASTPTESKG